MVHRILLIQPPFYRLYKDTCSLDRYPLALGYLAGAVKQHTDWEVMVYNADFSVKSEAMEHAYTMGPGFENYLNNLRQPTGTVWNAVRETILAFQPHVVAISAKSQDFAAARIVAQIAKQIDNNALVVAGGPHPSMVGQEVLRYPEIDVCVRGEGEVTLVELLTAIAASTGFEKVAGIAYRCGAEIVETGPRALIDDLDILPIPHGYAPEVLKDYAHYPVEAFSHVMAIRGCPFQCTFCGSRYIWSCRPRFRSPEHVIKEIEGLRRKGVSVFDFEDDTFGVSRKYIRDLCATLIEHCPGIRWTAELHVKLVDDEILSLMERAGCCSVQLGVESGSNRILKEIRKDITIEEALAACKTIKKHGLKLLTFIMLGFPQETEETLQATVKALKLAKADSVVCSIFTPYPGTEMFQYCREQGLIPQDYNVSLYNHLSPANSFCLNIAPERFRALASDILRMVDRTNRRRRFRNLFSAYTFRRICEMGFPGTVKKCGQVLRGK